MAFSGRYDHAYSTGQYHGAAGDSNRRHTPYDINVRQDNDLVSPLLCIIPIHQRTPSNPSPYQFRAITTNERYEDHTFITSRETGGFNGSAQRLEVGKIRQNSLNQNDQSHSAYNPVHEYSRYDQYNGNARRDRFFQSDQSSKNHDDLGLKRSLKKCKQGPNDTLLEYIRTMIEFYMELGKPLIGHRFITRVLGGINSMYAPFCTIMDIDLATSVDNFVERAKEIDEIVARTKELTSPVNVCSIEYFPNQPCIEHRNCPAKSQLQTINNDASGLQMILGFDLRRGRFFHSDQSSNKKKHVHFRIDSDNHTPYNADENNKEVVQELDNSDRPILSDEIDQPSVVNVDVVSSNGTGSKQSFESASVQHAENSVSNEVSPQVVEATVANFQTIKALPSVKLVAYKSGKRGATRSDSRAGLLSLVSPSHLWSLVEMQKPWRQWNIRTIHSRLVYMPYENG